MSSELFEALDMLEREKGINTKELIEKIISAITVSIKKNYNVEDDAVQVEIDPKTQKFKASIIKDIVDEVTDPNKQISLEEALTKNRRSHTGAKMNVRLDTKQIGRIAVLSGKNLIHQSISEAIKNNVVKQYQNKQFEVIDAKVNKIDPRSGNAVVEIDKTMVTLFKSEQLANDRLQPGDSVKVYVTGVIDDEKKCIIKITRIHKDLVKRLLEKEIPEIYEGIVKIMSISREAGLRTKVAVSSSDPNVDPVGACIGQKGARINTIVVELRGEKIDVIKYSDVPETYIAQALSPADVESVSILNPDEKICRVIVPDNQLSLAIGNKGQNAKLAAKLTGYKIDIKSRSLIEAEAKAKAAAEAEAEAEAKAKAAVEAEAVVEAVEAEAVVEA